MSFKYLGSCSSTDGMPQQGVKVRVEEGLEIISGMKMIFHVRSVIQDVMSALYERKVVRTVIYAAKT